MLRTLVILLVATGAVEPAVKKGLTCQEDKIRCLRTAYRNTPISVVNNLANQIKSVDSRIKATCEKNKNVVVKELFIKNSYILSVTLPQFYIVKQIQTRTRGRFIYINANPFVNFVYIKILPYIVDIKAITWKYYNGSLTWTLPFKVQLNAVTDLNCEGNTDPRVRIVHYYAEGGTKGRMKRSAGFETSIGKGSMPKNTTNSKTVTIDSKKFASITQAFGKAVSQVKARIIAMNDAKSKTVNNENVNTTTSLGTSAKVRADSGANVGSIKTGNGAKQGSGIRSSNNAKLKVNFEAIKTALAKAASKIKEFISERITITDSNVGAGTKPGPGTTANSTATRCTCAVINATVTSGAVAEAGPGDRGNASAGSESIIQMGTGAKTGAGSGANASTPGNGSTGATSSAVADSDTVVETEASANSDPNSGLYASTNSKTASRSNGTSNTRTASISKSRGESAYSASRSRTITKTGKKGKSAVGATSLAGAVLGKGSYSRTASGAINKDDDGVTTVSGTVSSSLDAQGIKKARTLSGSATVTRVTYQNT